MNRARVVVCTVLLALAGAARALETVDLKRADDATCIAVAAYWEAFAEGPDGMTAVAMVVLNRMRDSRFPATACEVVREGGEQPGCQFSFWCDGRSDVPDDPERWLDARRATDVAFGHALRGEDPTGGALYFHSTDIDVPWKVPREETARIGKHVFYR